MTTQLDFEKRKKQTNHPDEKTNASPVLLTPTTNEKTAKDTVEEPVFCAFCECYHKPNEKIRCAFNRAIMKSGKNRS